MSETSAYCLIECESEAQRNRLAFYLDEETRPDFEDEVPESERALFAEVDGFPEPETIEKTLVTTLFVYFEYEGEEAMERLPHILKLEKLSNCIFLEFYDGVTSAYHRFNSNRFDLLYSAELEDEIDTKSLKSWLNTDEIACLKDKAQNSFYEAMLFLANNE